MAGSFNLKAIISGVDKLSPMLKAQSRNVRAWSRSLSAAGAGAIPMAAGLGAAMLLPIRAFAQQEDAAIALKSALMGKNGLSSGFDELNKIAVELGNQLPGTTSDFAQMATVMKRNGIAVEQMVNGGLKAAAYLAIATQGNGETYESAALGMAKISNVFAVADKDLVSLADTIQRVSGLGVGIEPFTSAMSKAGGILKGLGAQGLGAAQDIAPLIAMMTRAGIDPSEAGTGLKKLFAFTGGSGKFESIQKTIESLQKLYKADPKKAVAAFNKIFGEEHATKLINIAMPGGYEKMKGEFEAQADLNKRVALSLTSLTNLWGAFTGTVTNAAAALGLVYAPEVKSASDKLNGMAGAVMSWIPKNEKFIATLALTATSLVAVKLAMLGLAFATRVAAGAMAFFAAMSPLKWIILLAQGIALVAPMIYENWGAITSFLKDTFGGAIDWILEKWETLKAAFAAAGEFIKPAIDMLTPGSASNPGATPQQQQAQSARNKRLQASNGTVRGGIDVNFNNTPAGARVSSKTQGPVAVTPKVGYRTIGAN